MISIYLYPNSIEVQFLDSSINTTRNLHMYDRPVKIYQGIDNPIQVKIKNQDQKKINATGYNVYVDVNDHLNSQKIETYQLDFNGNVGGNIAAGIGSFTITKETIDLLDQRIYKLAFKIINIASGDEKPLYTDGNYQVPVDLVVLPGYYNNQI